MVTCCCGMAEGRAHCILEGMARILRLAGVTSAASFREKMGIEPDARAQAAIALAASAVAVQ